MFLVVAVEFAWNGVQVNGLAACRAGCMAAWIARKASHSYLESLNHCSWKANRSYLKSLKGSDSGILAEAC